MKVLAALLFFASVIIGQAKDPDTLVAMVKNEFDKIEDYEVDVVIKIDINFLKVPESKAKIFFKKPDKVRLKSEGFALLPKEGLNFSPSASAVVGMPASMAFQARSMVWLPMSPIWPIPKSQYMFQARQPPKYPGL